MSSLKMCRAAGAVAAAVVWLGTTAPVVAQNAPPVRVLASNGVRAVLDELVPHCEHSLGRSVAIEFGTSTALRQQIAGGAAVDVVFATAEAVGELAKQGHLAAASVTPVGRAGIGVGIRTGARRLDIGTSAALKSSLLAARSVTYAADGASRVHIERMFDELGITAEMKQKTLLEQGSVRAAAKVVNGEAELLITLVSEILPVAGMDLLGSLPKEHQSYVSFAAALGAHAQQTDSARALVACVTAPANAATFVAKGMER